MHGGAPTSGAAAGLTERLHALIDRAPSAKALVYHRLAALAAPRWRALGRAVPETFADEEQLGAVCTIAAPAALERIAAIVPGPLLLLKGPEVARHHPAPHGRPYRDLDLLAEDPRAAFEALVAAGASVTKEVAPGHHEPPLVFDDLPLVIEVHRLPKWPAGLVPPPPAELFAAAVPAPWGDGRILTLPPARHAIVVAAHAWAHRPLRRILDLVDVAVLLRDGDRSDAWPAARSWGAERLLTATVAAADAVLGDGRRPFALRSWARDLPAVRERGPGESLLESYLAPFSGLPALPAARQAAGRAVRELRTRASSRGR